MKKVEYFTSQYNRFNNTHIVLKNVLYYLEDMQRLKFDQNFYKQLFILSTNSKLVHYFELSNTMQ